MPTIAATEFCRNFGTYEQEARREPIEVTSHGQVTGYFLSPEEFERYRRLLASSRQAVHPSDLPDHLKRAISEARMDPRHAHLDSLLDGA